MYSEKEGTHWYLGFADYPSHSPCSAGLGRIENLPQALSHLFGHGEMRDSTILNKTSVLSTLVASHEILKDADFFKRVRSPGCWRKYVKP